MVSRGIKSFSKIILPLTLALLVAGIPISCAEPLALPEEPTPPAKFGVTSLDIKPSEVITGETVTITAQVKNTGGSSGIYTVVLTLDGIEIGKKDITVAPGNMEAVTFSLVKNKAGTYEIAIGELSSSLTVNEIAATLEDLKVVYPELFQELLKLPELKEIDEKDNEAIADIAYLASGPKYRTAFESMLNEGIKDKRKYCTPLQALLWIAYDKEFDGYNPLKDYSLERLLNDAWENTSTPNNYQSIKWQDFNEVIDRLNSPALILQYAKDNITYDFESQECILKGERVWAKTPSQTFDLKMGNCNDQGRFALYCLLQNGYTYYNLQGTNRAACCLRAYLTEEQRGVGHVSCLYKDGSDMFYILNLGHLDSAQNSIEGPFSNIEEAADATYTPWIRYVFFDVNQNITYGPIQKVVWHPEDTKCKIDGSIDEWPSDIAMVSDPTGDVSSDAKDKRGIDLKAVRAFMDEDYLYVAIQIYDVFEPSLLRNYFIALDYDGDRQDEYHFGLRPDGSTWVFDHTIDKSNWTAEDTWGVLAVGQGDTIEVVISKKEYGIPSNILIYCRVTEGGPTVDTTEWFEVAVHE